MTTTFIPELSKSGLSEGVPVNLIKTDGQVISGIIFRVDDQTIVIRKYDNRKKLSFNFSDLKEVINLFETGVSPKDQEGFKNMLAAGYLRNEKERQKKSTPTNIVNFNRSEPGIKDNNHIEDDEELDVEETVFGELKIDDNVTVITKNRELFDGVITEVSEESLTIELDDAETGLTSFKTFADVDVEKVLWIGDDDAYDYIEYLEDAMNHILQALKRVRKESKEKHTVRNLNAIIGVVKEIVG